ncbi:NUDIX domain-containing protein, partial [Chromobacterium piscinae]
MDNLVGGGVAAGETLELALERESWEEAGIARERVHGLKPSSLLLAQRPVARGLHREWLYAYDLWLAPGESPACQDGEVAEHLLLPLAEVEQLLVAERFM